MRINNIIREYFTFSRNERVGLIVLIGLIFLVGIANKLLFYFETPTKIDKQAFQKIISQGQSQIQKVEKPPVKNKGLFFFDPNLIDSLSLDSLNLPEDVKRNLLKYRQKGGKFSVANDLGKLYGMDDSTLLAVMPFVVIKRVKENPQLDVVIKSETEFSSGKLSQNDKSKLIEINTASESDLKSLYGIGEKLSTRIVKYRNLLGGFYSLSQLSEVYGLRDETISGILPFLTIDTLRVHRLNINFASKKELAGHPYIDWSCAQTIIDFRSKAGFITGLDRLKTGNILNDSIYIKIRPYLKTKN